MADPLVERLADIYDRRWTPDQERALAQVWRILVGDYFQQFVDPDSTVLDLAAGRCHFINNVTAARRIAFDGNPKVVGYAAPGVEVIVSTDLLLPQIGDGELGHVFISNFLEHLPDAATALKLLQAVHRTLRPSGTVLILQPNFRYVGARYFDFIDHQLVLTEKSLAEAFDVTGFRISHMVRRFLPYTAKSALPTHPFLVRAYLKVPILWRIFGGQTFVVGTKA